MVVTNDNPLGRWDERRAMDALEEATGMVVEVRMATPQEWSDNRCHPLAWERVAEKEGAWITDPVALPEPAPHEQVCTDRAVLSLEKVAWSVRRLAISHCPSPREVKLILENRQRGVLEGAIATSSAVRG